MFLIENHGLRRVLISAVAAAVCSLLWISPAGATTQTKGQQVSKSTKSTRSGKVHRTKSKSKRRGSWKKRGQQDIDGQRATAIQEALIREKYLDGEPTGKWDDRTKQAILKYQEDNGWQTKVLPDSRAIIKLGLGPSNEGLINPDTAATAMSASPALPAEKNASEATGRSGSSH